MVFVLSSISASQMIVCGAAKLYFIACGEKITCHTITTFLSYFLTNLFCVLLFQIKFTNQRKVIAYYDAVGTRCVKQYELKLMKYVKKSEKRLRCVQNEFNMMAHYDWCWRWFFSFLTLARSHSLSLNTLSTMATSFRYSYKFAR